MTEPSEEVKAMARRIAADQMDMRDDNSTWLNEHPSTRAALAAILSNIGSSIEPVQKVHELTSGEALNQLQAMGQDFDAKQNETLHRAHLASLDSLTMPTSGEEMRLVPVEPTEEMYLAAFASDHWGGVQPIRRVVDEIWSSMLRAALTKGADRHD